MEAVSLALTWGGGTLDVSVWYLDKDVLEVKATGDPNPNLDARKK